MLRVQEGCTPYSIPNMGFRRADFMLSYRWKRAEERQGTGMVMFTVKYSCHFGSNDIVALSFVVAIKSL